MVKNIPTALYKQINRYLPIACVDLVITDGKSFLLVKRRNRPQRGKWWLPGGRILKNETLVSAVKRKVREETGLRARSIKELGTYEFFSAESEFLGIGRHNIAVSFIVKVAPGRVRLDGQSKDYFWAKCVSGSWHPYVRRVLRRAGFR